MTSLILQTASRVLSPLTLLVSVGLLARGHDQPGGGFVGGLVAAAAFGLHSISFGVRAARATLPCDPRSLIAAGLLVAACVAAAPLALGEPFFTAIWVRAQVAAIGQVELGSPLVFDVGVYLTVAGAALCMLFVLEEEE